MARRKREGPSQRETNIKVRRGKCPFTDDALCVELLNRLRFTKDDREALFQAYLFLMERVEGFVRFPQPDLLYLTWLYAVEKLSIEKKLLEELRQKEEVEPLGFLGVYTPVLAQPTWLTRLPQRVFSEFLKRAKAETSTKGLSLQAKRKIPHETSLLNFLIAEVLSRSGRDRTWSACKEKVHRDLQGFVLALLKHELGKNYQTVYSSRDKKTILSPLEEHQGKTPMTDVRRKVLGILQEPQQPRTSYAEELRKIREKLEPEKPTSPGVSKFTEELGRIAEKLGISEIKPVSPSAILERLSTTPPPAILRAPGR